ncbi:hypothetical protein [Nitrosococcus wardiae]|nr:hypothetical protein [Nitrosococcus wardiae]
MSLLNQKIANNRLHSDSKKRRSFVALLFVAGDLLRYVVCRSIE